MKDGKIKADVKRDELESKQESLEELFFAITENAEEDKK